MFAPRRLPPCLMLSVAASKIFMNDTGPRPRRPVDETTSPLGRRCENEKPVPPPLLLDNGHLLITSKMPSIVSGTGGTKHALNWPSAVPAFIRARAVGQGIERNRPPGKLFMPACDLARVAERRLPLCDGVRHALKKLLRGGLDDLAPCITPQDGAPQEHRVWRFLKDVMSVSSTRTRLFLKSLR